MRASVPALLALLGPALHGCYGPNPDYDGVAAGSIGSGSSAPTAADDDDDDDDATADQGDDGDDDDDDDATAEQGDDDDDDSTSGEAGESDSTGGEDGAASCLGEPGASLLDCYKRQEVALSQGPHPLAVADLDGDGFADVAAGRRGNSLVSILYGGPRGLAEPKDFGAGGQPLSDLVAVDLDENGTLDLVAFDATDNNNNLTILAGFDGTWTALPKRSAGGHVQAAQLADVNHDGRADLMTLYTEPTRSPLGYLPTSDMLPLLGDAVSIEAPATEPAAFSAGDLDGDSDLDYVLADPATPALHIGLREEDTDWNVVPIPLRGGAAGWTVGLGDFDGDGLVDLVYATGAEDIVVSLGDGAGRFSRGDPFGVSVAPTSLAVADVDSDGALDVMLGDDALGVTLALGDGRGGFKGALQAPEPGVLQDIGCGDINGDGVDDLVLTLEDSTLVAWQSTARSAGVPR